MIAQGDYSEFVDRQVNQLLDDNPDAQAIVFANDEMAFTAYRVCEKRGLTVGQDILITGFDNCERASGMDPSLTTVQQDGVLMGKMAVYDLFDKLNGKRSTFAQSPCFPVCKRILRLSASIHGILSCPSRSDRTDTTAEPHNNQYEA